MKAYFTVPNLLNNTRINSGNYSTTIKLNNFVVDGVQLMTPAFITENDASKSAAINPITSNLWYFGDCTQTGVYPNNTSITACNIINPQNSFNPFAASWGLTYSDTVGGLLRGEIATSISGNGNFLIPYKFGFDKIEVPVNDILGGGSSGATVQGSFYLDIDPTVNLLMGMTVSIYDDADPNPNASPVESIYFELKFTSVNCTFESRFQQDANPFIDCNTVNWLSGGLSGWITPNCSTPIIGTCNPIVTQSICFLAQAPQTPASIFGDLEGCCYISPVFGHLTENDEWKNDINSFLLKRNFASETIDLVLEKNGAIDIPLIDNTYGTYYNFGSLTPYDNYKGYKIEWQKVLQVDGEGNYRLKATSTLISGVVIEYSIPFQLKGYTEQLASGTVRIQSIMNGFLRHRDFDFKGLNWIDGLRVRGFFGNRQPEYEQEQIIYTNRQSRQLRSEMINVYTLQTMHIPSCITDTIIEYHNFANTLYITDYNRKNHKDYVQKEVVFDTMETIAYNSVSKYATLEIKYKDYLQNYLKSNC